MHSPPVTDHRSHLRYQSAQLLITLLLACPAHAGPQPGMAAVAASCSQVCDRELSCCADDAFRDAWLQGCAALDFGGCPFTTLDASTVVSVAESAFGSGGECDFDAVWAQWTAMRTPCSTGRSADDTEPMLEGLMSTLRVTAMRGWRTPRRSQSVSDGASMRQRSSQSWMVALELAVAWRVR